MVKGSGVKRVGCEEGGERGSSTSVENTEYLLLYSRNVCPPSES